MTEKELIVYVDVDDTLIRTVGSKRIPMLGVIERVKQLYDAGANLYCWSSGGAEYAKSSAKELGIERCFLSFLPKPNLMIDDQEVADWRLCMEKHPLSLAEQSLADYWQEIRENHRS